MVLNSRLMKFVYMSYEILYAVALASRIRCLLEMLGYHVIVRSNESSVGLARLRFVVLAVELESLLKELLVNALSHLRATRPPEPGDWIEYASFQAVRTWATGYFWNAEVDHCQI